MEIKVKGTENVPSATEDTFGLSPEPLASTVACQNASQAVIDKKRRESGREKVGQRGRVSLACE